MARLHALFVLAWALVRTLIGHLMGQSRGLADFRQSYADDRLLPATADERALLASANGCIACGLCEVGSGARGVPSLPLATSRSATDADAAERTLASVSDESLARAERICPGRVPLRALATLTRARAAAISR